MSQLTSTGKIKLTRKGDEIIVSGDIQQLWKDTYDWNAGASAYIPGFGDISDEDGIYLKENGGAKDFRLVRSWHTTVSGTITIHSLWFNSVDIKLVHRDKGK